MTTPLQCEEWDFPTISDDLIDFVFFYEFSRSSKKMRNAVIEYRRLHPYLMTEPFDPSEPLFFNGEEYKTLHPFERNQIDMLEKLFKENAFLHVIDWLSYCPNFPGTPFFQLEETEYLNKRRVPANIRGIHSLGEKFGNGKGMQSAPLINYKFWDIGDIQGFIKEYQSYHVPIIDWRKTDAELVDDFRDWIKVMRSMSGTKPTPAYARGLFNEPIPMPPKCRKKETALVFLGTLRKRNSCETWKEYMEKFCHTDADLRDEKKKVAGANQLIHWMESNI